MISIVCPTCSVKLNIPEDKLPPNLTHFAGKCPKCANKIEVNLDRGAAGAAAPPAAVAAPAHAPSAAPPPPAILPPVSGGNGHQAETTGSAAAAEPPPAIHRPPASAPMTPPLHEDDLGEDVKLAMVCFDKPEQQAAAKAALEAMEYTVHAPATMPEAVQRLRRSHYHVVLLHEEYGGSRSANDMLKALQPMPMATRRRVCLGLVGKGFRTFDNMAAFANSANFVVSEADTDKIGGVVKQAVLDNQNFYKSFIEALKDEGKA